MKDPQTKKYEDIKATYDQLNANATLLDMLLEFEELLDNIGLYGYKNWQDGEVVSGPNLQRHWVSITLMYDHENMPDPEGGLRIKKLKGEVFFEKGRFKEPVKVSVANAYRDSISKAAPLKEKTVWLVTVKLPRSLLNSAMDEYIEERVGLDDLEEFSKTGDSEVVDNNQQVDDIVSGLDDMDNFGDDMEGLPQ